ncbi:MAG: nuclear transport factor 2 family protein [Acidobacteriales bacterium]|nr:nuclear transport factor 2 family protein [Terriglobales bacterium]
MAIRLAAAMTALCLAVLTPATSQTKVDTLAEQARTAEARFAKTMADRDHKAFASMLADEAVFFSPKGPLRGSKAVAEAWKPFFEGAQPPFSWEPERVEVLDSGGLAFSTGPVKNPQGKRVGTFNSVWRRNAQGQWKIVFDSGCPPCNCPSPASPN